MSSTSSQPAGWLDFLDRGLPIEVKLEIRAILVSNLNVLRGRAVEAAHRGVMLGDINWHLLADLDVDWAPKASDVGSAVLVKASDIG